MVVTSAWFGITLFVCVRVSGSSRAFFCFFYSAASYVLNRVNPQHVLQMRLDAGIDDAMSDGSDEESDGDSFDYDSADSDVTHGWNSQDDSLSSDDGMRTEDR